MKAEGTTYVDAVFVTDGNLEQVLDEGTTELWVIWTVSRKGRIGHWPGGTFFQTVEQTANGRLKQVERRIERSNAAGTEGEFGQRVDMRILYGEVPSGYLFVFTRGQLQRAVEQGVRETRAWCRLNGFPLKEPARPDIPRPMRFTEVLAGDVQWANTTAPWKLSVDVTARIGDIDAFVTEDGRRARPAGSVHCEELGGTLPIEDGAIEIFVPSGTDGVSLISYRICFRDSTGHPLTLIGAKRMTGTLWHLWRETTTVENVRLLDDGPEPLASGTLKLSPFGFLTTTGGLVWNTVWLPWLLPGRLASGRYLRFFGSQLWRLYRPRLRGRTPVGEDLSAS